MMSRRKLDGRGSGAAGSPGRASADNGFIFRSYRNGSDCIVFGAKFKLVLNPYANEKGNHSN
jgi:hypothetical protein